MGHTHTHTFTAFLSLVLSPKKFMVKPQSFWVAMCLYPDKLQQQTLHHWYFSEWFLQTQVTLCSTLKKTTSLGQSSYKAIRVVLRLSGEAWRWGWMGRRRRYSGNVREVEVRWLLMALPDPQDLWRIAPCAIYNPADSFSEPSSPFNGTHWDHKWCRHCTHINSLGAGQKLQENATGGGGRWGAFV